MSKTNILPVPGQRYYSSGRNIHREMDGQVETLMLKLQCFGHLMRRADPLEKTLMLGKIEGKGEGGDRG